MVAILEPAKPVRGRNSRPIIEGTSTEVLDKVLRPATGLAIWRRQLSPAVAAAARGLCDKLVCETYSLPAAQADTFNKKTSLQLLPDDIIEDLHTLMRLYRGITKADRVSLRLETVTDDGCRRFHIDNVPYRMVTTYCGMGTQWVLPGDEQAASVQQENYAGELGTLHEGDVALFRGKKSVGHGVLHRSPQLPAGARRLVCVIDAIKKTQPMTHE
ncbi:MAG: DUF1826 domain-containing protein [Aquisalinus sp.]|nr:DUF1826 domain-containing protein [Aquisalinus sp.]